MSKLTDEERENMSKEFIEVRGEGGWLRFIAVDTILQMEVLWPDKAKVFTGYEYFEAQIEDVINILGYDPFKRSVGRESHNRSEGKVSDRLS